MRCFLALRILHRFINTLTAAHLLHTSSLSPNNGRAYFSKTSKRMRMQKDAQPIATAATRIEKTLLKRTIHSCSDRKQCQPKSGFSKIVTQLVFDLRRCERSTALLDTRLDVGLFSVNKISFIRRHKTNK